MRPRAAVVPVGNPVTIAIASRRSVREGFSGEAIPEDVLCEIVRAGLAGPSSKHARPWQLHVVSDRVMLREIADTVESSEGAETYVPRDPSTGLPRSDWASTVAESADVLRHVSAGIFVENRGAFSNGRRTLAAVDRDHLVGSLVGYTFEVLGIGAAIENMWLAANALGVQGVYMGDVVIAEREIAQRLGLEVDLVGVLALGYSEAPVPLNRVSYDVNDPEHVVWHGQSPTGDVTP